jgi:Putative restriction endonuclease
MGGTRIGLFSGCLPTTKACSQALAASQQPCYCLRMSTRAQNRSALPVSPRLHWRERTDLTIDDIEELVQANTFTGYDRLERIDGRLVPQLNRAAKRYLQPDILLRPRAIRTPCLRGQDTLLVIEVANTSLPSDINTKAAIYAAYGVREYWVINAANLVTTLHLAPSANGYGRVDEIQPDQLLVPSLAQALAVQLDQLDV